MELGDEETSIKRKNKLYKKTKQHNNKRVRKGKGKQKFNKNSSRKKNKKNLIPFQSVQLEYLFIRELSFCPRQKVIEVCVHTV